MGLRDLEIVGYLNDPGEMSLSDVRDFIQQMEGVPDCHLILISEETVGVFRRNFKQLGLETDYGLLISYQSLEPAKPITVLKALERLLKNGER